MPQQASPSEVTLVEHLLPADEGTLLAIPVQPADPADPDTADSVDVDEVEDSLAPELILGPGAAEIIDRWEIDLLAILAAHQATGRAGSITRVPLLDDDTATTMLVVGVGAATPADLRAAGAATARAAKGAAVLRSTVASVAPDLAGVEAYVVGALLGGFRFAWRAEPEPTQQPVSVLELAGLGQRPEVAETVERGVVLAQAGWTSRLLATVPSNVKSPAWLAAQAQALAAEVGLECTILEEGDLERGGFGGILGVGQASATPPRLIRLDYVPAGLSKSAAKRTPRVVLVGKGITFDAGGLSIKPAEGMKTMKRDMTGGAVVIAVLAALARLGAPVRVTGLIAAAENAVGGNALRPGDVLRQFGGRTTEVTNTDAEGRLVLADALAYAVEELDPALLVDVATLTGAGKVALGLRTGALFATTDTLAEALFEAGRDAGEPLWRLPLASAYESKLASPIADADNAPGGPGAITAALFLQHFTGGLPWAHLDIASVGDAASDSGEWTTGPTGFGARLLTTWLADLDPADLPTT